MATTSEINQFKSIFIQNGGGLNSGDLIVFNDASQPLSWRNSIIDAMTDLYYLTDQFGAYYFRTELFNKLSASDNLLIEYQAGSRNAIGGFESDQNGAIVGSEGQLLRRVLKIDPLVDLAWIGKTGQSEDFNFLRIVAHELHHAADLNNDDPRWIIDGSDPDVLTKGYKGITVETMNDLFDSNRVSYASGGNQGYIDYLTSQLTGLTGSENFDVVLIGFEDQDTIKNPGQNFSTRINGVSDNGIVDLLIGLDNDDGLDNDNIISSGDGDDWIYGFDGMDTLSGDAGDDRIYGGDGDDIIEGGDEDDYLNGGADNDNISGGLGDDFILTGLGIANRVDGGGDDDLIIAQGEYASGGYTDVNGNEGNDYTVLHSGSLLLTDDAGHDALRFLSSNGRASTLEPVFVNGQQRDLFVASDIDVLIGTNSDDTLSSNGSENIYLAGGYGSDEFFLSDEHTGTMIVFGGQGADLIYAPTGSSFQIINVAGLTEDNFHELDLSDPTVYSGPDINLFDVVIVNPDSEDEILTGFENTYQRAGAVNTGPAITNHPQYDPDHHGLNSFANFIFVAGSSGLVASSSNTYNGSATLHRLLGVTDISWGTAGELEVFTEIRTVSGSWGFETVSTEGYRREHYPTDGIKYFGGEVKIENDCQMSAYALDVPCDPEVETEFYLDEYTVKEAFFTVKESIGSLAAGVISGPWGVFGGSLNGSTIVSSGAYTASLPADARDIEDRLIAATTTSASTTNTSTENMSYSMQSDTVLLASFAQLQSVETLAGDDTVTDSEYADNIDTGSGNDTVYTEFGNDTVSLGSGDDLIFGYLGDKNVLGGEGNDTIVLGSGNDVINGQSGDDVIDAGAGDDIIYGGIGNDVISVGATGSNLIFAEDGDDTIYAGEGANSIDGGSGVDTLYIDHLAAVSMASIDLGEGTLIWTSIFSESALTSIENVSASNMSDTVLGNEASNLIFGNGGDDQIWGEDGDDTLNGGLGDDTIYGGVGADVLNGNDGEDMVFGELGDDILDGGAGNDVLEGGEGDDSLSGGFGNDRLIGGAGIDTAVFLNASTDYIFIESEGYVEVNLRGVFVDEVASDVEFFEFTDGTFSAADILPDVADGVVVGTLGNDVIDTAFVDPSDGDQISASGQTINALAGNDIIFDGAGHDTVDGGAGDDTFIVGTGQNDYDGGTGSDTIDYSAFSSWIRVNLQTNSTSGGRSGNAAGNDTITNIESVIGTSGADRLTGNGVSNRLEGGEGDDRLEGNDGNDKLYGEEGSDTLLAGGGNDIVHGGNGQDLVYLGAGDDKFFDTTEADASGNDTVFGGNGNDLLSGKGGVDDLNGGNGNDSIFGRAGWDILTGRGGQDRLVGGAGADTFVYVARSDSLAGAATRDTIDGYDLGSDIIDLSSVDSNNTVGGNQAFSFIGNSAFSGTAGELRYERDGGSNAIIISVDQFGNSSADMEIYVSGITQIGQGDFIL